MQGDGFGDTNVNKLFGEWARDRIMYYRDNVSVGTPKLQTRRFALDEPFEAGIPGDARFANTVLVFNVFKAFMDTCFRVRQQKSGFD